MAESPDPELTRAYGLIKAGKRSEAAMLLQQFLAYYPYDSDGWWLMAHAAATPEQRIQYLERVLQLNPHHEKAQAALRKMSVSEPAFAPAAPSDSFEAELPLIPAGGDVAQVFSPPLEMLAPAAVSQRSVVGPYDPYGPLMTRRMRIPPSPEVIQRRKQIAMITALVAVVVIVLIGLILFGMDRVGWIDLDGVPPMTSLKSRLYRMEYPEDWKAQCKTGANDASVCSVYTDDNLNLISAYLSETFTVNALAMQGGDALYEAGKSDPAVSGIVMDVPSGSPQATTILAQQQNEEMAAQMMSFGVAALGIKYHRAEWTIDGNEAVFFRLTVDMSGGGALMFEQGDTAGCVAVYSLYMPHDDRLLWATFYGFVDDKCEKLPDKAVRHMLKSIQLVD